eukprot:6210457-Pleurochrysis_carterae.AAC.5
MANEPATLTVTNEPATLTVTNGPAALKTPTANCFVSHDHEVASSFHFQTSVASSSLTAGIINYKVEPAAHQNMIADKFQLLAT